MAKKRKQRDRRHLPNRRSGRDLRTTERRQRFAPVLVDKRGDEDQRKTPDRRGGSDRRAWTERRRSPS